MQTLSLFIFALVALALVFHASASPIETAEQQLNELNIIDPATLDEPIRNRRQCDCTTTTGRCVPRGKYECYFVNGASIVQCVGGNQWITIGKCPSSCRSWGNDQPYCS
ncbi:hypothetical protein I4U23_012713 [Adineta vaga]|nr:hypothetical protein I4U23_012713 [Adineta vaga]